MPELSLAAYIAIAVALALGGIVKGATGLGAPVVAVPVMAAFFDVRLAVVIMVVPNLFTNLWQIWTFRATRLAGPFAWRFALAGGLGAAIGSAFLSILPARVLTGTVALAVVAYIALRVARPDFTVPLSRAERVAWPVGTAAGVLQGAAGISAPISASFLNAMRLPRAEFIPTISLFFVLMCVTQIPTLMAFGLMTTHLALLGILALVPLVAFMPLGAHLSRTVSARTFDRMVLVLLAVLALRLIQQTVF